VSEATILTDRFDRALLYATHVQTLWYYSSLAAVFRKRLPGQLAEELHEIVEVLAGTESRPALLETAIGDLSRHI